MAAGEGAGAWPDRDGARLLGFAHGAAGVACALARLSAATGDASYRHAARRAYRFVRRHQLQASGHWPIGVDTDGMGLGGIMTGWCHGSPGISMAALAAASVRPSPALRHGIESALRTVGPWQPAQADHLCCGALGRADVLATVGQQFDRPDATALARALATRVVERARRRGHFRLSGAGTDYRVFDPGFFQGLSGIGYQLLRMAHPSDLPSVAGFEAARASLRYCSPVAGGASHQGALLDRPAGAVSTECTS